MGTSLWGHWQRVEVFFHGGDLIPTTAGQRRLCRNIYVLVLWRGRLPPWGEDIIAPASFQGGRRPCPCPQVDVHSPAFNVFHKVITSGSHTSIAEKSWYLQRITEKSLQTPSTPESPTPGKTSTQTRLLTQRTPWLEKTANLILLLRVFPGSSPPNCPGKPTQDNQTPCQQEDRPDRTGRGNWPRSFVLLAMRQPRQHPVKLRRDVWSCDEWR